MSLPWTNFIEIPPKNFIKLKNKKSLEKKKYTHIILEGNFEKVRKTFHIKHYISCVEANEPRNDTEITRTYPWLQANETM